jgi:DNA-directed RNA polymerase subunit RPC12/RpoP
MLMDIERPSFMYNFPQKSLKGKTYEKGDFEQGKTCLHCGKGIIINREYSIGDCSYCGQPHRFNIKDRVFEVLEYSGRMEIPELIPTEKGIEPRFNSPQETIQGTQQESINE